jgi:hypothetical protein
MIIVSRLNICSYLTKDYEVAKPDASMEVPCITTHV